jgi:uncharacterized membrane protein YbhN (UPF0104 family)
MERMRSVFVLTLLVLALIAIAYYLGMNQPLLRSLTNITFQSAITLVLIRTVFVAANGLFLRMFALKLGVRLVWYEWIGLSYVTAMGNYLMPLSGGTVARAAYLKNRHALSYTHFATYLAVNYLIIVWVTALAGVLLAPIFLHEMPFCWILVSFFGVICIATSVIMLLRIPESTREGRFWLLLGQVVAGWKAVKDDKGLMGRLAFLAAFSVLLNGIAFWLGYKALDASVSAVPAMIVSFSSVFSTIVNLTPGNLGIHEAFVTLVSSATGLGVGTGLLVALIVRATTLIPVFILGPFFSALLAKHVRLNSST